MIGVLGPDSYNGRGAATESLFDSQMLIPARERTNIDWQSVNRIVKENRDFHRFIEQVGIYNQTGRLVTSVWNK